jgi:hypothetical protein
MVMIAFLDLKQITYLVELACLAELVQWSFTT